MTGVNWGSSQRTLTTTYKTSTKPVTKYGSEVLKTVNKSRIKPLETYKNNTLITVAVEITLMTAKELYIHHLPIEEDIKQQVAVTYFSLQGSLQTIWTKNTDKDFVWLLVTQRNSLVPHNRLYISK